MKIDINLYFKGDTKLMATLTEIVDNLNAVAESVAAIDLKLDDVRALVAALKAGTISQEEIDALAAKVDAVKTAVAAVQTEAQGIE